MRNRERDAAFTEFVLATQTRLRRVAYAICGDWTRADDLLQTAYVKAYAAWPRIRRKGAEEAFVRTIIMRAHVDEYRRPWRRELPGLDDYDHHPARAELPVEDRAALIEALQELPVMQRKVVVLRHWLGLSTAETARELDIGEGTVKSHGSRGLAQLREQLSVPEHH